MAEVKWIKLATNVFNNRKIRLIESMPDGDTIIVIWFKLLMLAGEINDEGNIYFTKELAYTDQMLATVFDRPIATIQLSLKTFEEFGMIEIIDNIIHISNWEKYQNVAGLEKIREQTKKRVARHREKRRIEQNIITCSYCGGKATGFDHIIPTSRGGSDEDSNKVPCCFDCNRIKNDKPLVDFLNNNRDRIIDDLVTSNPKLTRYVTLCNVTDRYNVTQCNATDIDIEEDKDIDKVSKEKDKPKGLSKKKTPEDRNIIPPTVEMVRAYCQERNNDIDPENFVDFYTSKGWKIGKDKMKDWQATVRTWEKNRKKETKKNDDLEGWLND